MLTARDIKELRALQQRRNRERSGRFVAEGVRVVEDLLASALAVHWVVVSSSLEDGDRGRTLLGRIEGRGIPVRRVPDRDFAALAGTETPQGVIAVAGIPRSALETVEDATLPALVLVMDGIQDPGNVGTLIRSAEAFGAAAVIALPGTADPWNPKAVRAAVGSSFRVPVVASAWPVARDWLRSRGYRILGADMAGEPVPVSLPTRAALVLGNEGAGISRDLRAELEGLLAVPTRGRAESLNVTAAAAILMYEMTRAR